MTVQFVSRNTFHEVLPLSSFNTPFTIFKSELKLNAHFTLIILRSLLSLSYIHLNLFHHFLFFYKSIAGRVLQVPAQENGDVRSRELHPAEQKYYHSFAFAAAI